MTTADSPSAAILSIALANFVISSKNLHAQAYRPAEPADFRPGVPLYSGDQAEVKLGSEAVPVRRHLAAGTTIAAAKGFVTYRELRGKTEILTMRDACARFWVCTKKQSFM